MNQNFRYPALSGPKAIRLIRLHEVASDLEPLRCTFLETTLESPTNYLALSYVWGTVNGPGKLIPLVVRTREADSVSDTTPQKFWATPNCAAALRTLAKNNDKLRGKSIWVDAICIDQNRPSEKNVQVAMMASIYRHASIIIIWLGSECAPKSQGELPRNNSMTTRLAAQSSRTRKLAVRRAAEASDAKRVELMMKAQYWTRVWTVQEAVYDSTEFLCQNGDSISGTMVFDVLNYVISRATEMPSDEQNSIVLRQKLLNSSAVDNGVRKKLAGGDRMQLDVSIIPALQGLDSSETRDHVYALRDLFPDTLADLQVRYDDPVDKVFMDATKCCLRHSGLSILVFAGSPIDPTGFPSWVIDWSTSTGINGAGLMSLRASASRNSNSYWNCNMAFAGPPGELLILGRRIGKIAEDSDIGPFMERGQRGSLDTFSRALRWFYTREFDHTEIREFKSMLEERSSSCFPGSSSSVTMETLPEYYEELRQCVKKLEDEVLDSLVQTEIAKFISWTLDNLDKNNDFKKNITLKAKKALDNLTESDKASLLSIWEGGYLFSTTGNKPGFCTHNVEEGDQVALLAGCSHPFVIRPASAGTSTIVGVAMLEGAMEGEYWPEDPDNLELFRLV